ncbi:MAG: hypothetical protein JJU41_11025 [Bacteroidetes bacterium]|nr:hypothetical protein [Bacteroidota bacterium]MCH8524499.1 hypothetical protein [Balneolales bacterium]
MKTGKTDPKQSETVHPANKNAPKSEQTATNPEGVSAGQGDVVSKTKAASTRKAELDYVPLAEFRDIPAARFSYTDRFVIGFVLLFMLAAAFDVMYGGEQKLALLLTRVVLVIAVGGLHWLLRAILTSYIAVHAALIATVLQAFTAQLLVPEIPISLYWGMAAFAVMVTPLAVNWSQTQSLNQWLAGLGITLLTIYAVPALELGVFLLNGGGFYLSALTFAIVLPVGWIPLQKRLKIRRAALREQIAASSADTPAVSAVAGEADLFDNNGTERNRTGSTELVDEAGERHEKTDMTESGDGPEEQLTSAKKSEPNFGETPDENQRTATPSRFGNLFDHAQETKPKPASRKKFNTSAFATLFEQGGVEPLQTEPVSASNVLTSALTSIQHVAASRSVMVEFIQPDTDVFVKANTTALHQVFSKILDNLLRNAEDNRLQVVLDVGTPYVDIHLAVSRYGLSSDDPEKLFEILDVFASKLEPYTAATSTELFTAASLLTRMEGSLLHSRTGTDVVYIRVRLLFDQEIPRLS